LREFCTKPGYWSPATRRGPTEAGAARGPDQPPAGSVDAKAKMPDEHTNYRTSLSHPWSNEIGFDPLRSASRIDVDKGERIFVIPFQVVRQSL